ncbi:hypothetical protein A2U01_0040534, partial [Trifolium medium]|nr:hypothetical protein [Trifolium medium]
VLSWLSMRVKVSLKEIKAHFPATQAALPLINVASAALEDITSTSSAEKLDDVIPTASLSDTDEIDPAEAN